MTVHDRNGHPIQLGDRVQADDGRVFTVTGMALRASAATSCEKIGKDAPLPRAEARGEGDTVIWGN